MRPTLYDVFEHIIDPARRADIEKNTLLTGIVCLARVELGVIVSHSQAMLVRSKLRYYMDFDLSEFEHQTYFKEPLEIIFPDAAKGGRLWV